MRKIRKGDDVIVTAGKDKGKRGSVLSVADDRVFVQGVNMIKRHTKPNPNAGVAGGIVEKEASLHVSNVMIYNSKENKGDRVGFRLEGDKKVRFFKSTGDVIDV
ncbi:MAG: 50S ribosomal protein L24 [Gammaproteobacteria bacterium]|nr:50S ribosomal protein L24 [Gammaproteobacteria bacterium]MDH5728671.1 50S ribosomal protein L24 [Gammaproteobacteria bacterium]